MALVTFTEGGGGGTALSDQQGYGTLAARPAAAASNQYYFYYATDNTTLYHSDGSSWIAMSSGAGDMAAATYDPATIAEQLVGLTATQTLTNKTLTQPTVTLKQGAAPTPTAEGDIQWDTDDDTIKVGDGTGQAVFPNQVDISAEIDGDISTHAALTTTHGISAFGATLVDDADAPTARTTLGVDAAGTDNSTDVTLAGTPDYITIAGQVITRNPIDLTADVTGVLPEANLPDASATAQGVVEIATAAEVDTGTDDTRALSPLALAGSALKSKVDGIEAAADVTDATNVASAGAVMADGTGNDITGDVVFTEKADHSSTPSAGKGYLWTKNTAPSTLVFTDDTGVDTTLGSGSGDLVAANNLSDVANAATSFSNIKQAASDSATGVVELATTAEIDTGTDTTRAVVPDALAASYAGTKSFCLVAFESDTDTAVGNGTIGFVVPASMASMDIVDCVASVHTAGTTGTTDVQIRRRRATTDADVLSTKLTIDSAETSSTTAATAHVINTANDDLNEGDFIFIDVDAVSTTAAKGLSVTIECRIP